METLATGDSVMRLGKTVSSVHTALKEMWPGPVAGLTGGACIGRVSPFISSGQGTVWVDWAITHGAPWGIFWPQRLVSGKGSLSSKLQKALVCDAHVYEPNSQPKAGLTCPQIPGCPKRPLNFREVTEWLSWGPNFKFKARKGRTVGLMVHLTSLWFPLGSNSTKPVEIQEDLDKGAGEMALWVSASCANTRT